MSLFPAYGPPSAAAAQQPGGGGVAAAALPPDLEPGDTESDEGASVSPARECSLLASDDSGDGCGGKRARRGPSPPPPPPPPDDKPYYVDRAIDRAFYLLSTLYCPSRPQYDPMAKWCALGAAGAAGAGRRRRRRRRRYWGAAAALADAGADAAQAEARAAAYRRQLAASPDDEALWCQYLDFQELSGTPSGLAGAAQAAQAAATARPHSAALRARLHDALRDHLPPHAYLERLRDDIAKEQRWGVRTELWVRLVTALAGGAAGAGDLPGAAAAAAAAAVADTRHHPHAYPRILEVFGCVLASCGLWERLVQLVELVVAMSLPGAAFPPPPAPEERAALDQLDDYELKVIESGLPLGEVWSRVERARAAAAWRPVPPGAALGDPQRGPLPADHAPLLLPALAQPELACALLRCVGEPLPAGGAPGWADGAPGWSGGALLRLARAARRLPPAHPAGGPARYRPVLAQAAPQRAGFDAWVGGLWAAALGALGGAPREALLCWRLRALHTRLLLLDPQVEADRSEARRLRGEAKAALRQYAGVGVAGALPLAQWARVQAAAGAALGTAGAALEAAALALHALRLALADGDAPAHDALYVARVVAELAGDGGAARWALACACVRRPVPPADRLERGPPHDVLRDALAECEKRCEELEHEFSCEPEDEEPSLLGRLRPAPAEWAAARVRLAACLGDHRHVDAMFSQVRELAGAGAGGPSAARYREAAACALGAAWPRHPRLPPAAAACPHNAYLALVSAGLPAWRRRWPGAPGGPRPRGELAALASALPALLVALAPRATPTDALRAERACWRALAGSGAGGAAGAGPLRALLVAVAARADPEHARHALLHALHHAPHYAWLYTLGASLCPSEAGALPDLLLERQLRLRALPDELRPLAAPAVPPAATAT